MDEMNPSKPAVAVIGATGHTGRFVVADVLRRGITPIAIARNAATLEAANFDTKVVRRQATVDDAESLDRALQGAQAVINTAGPFIETADPAAAQRCAPRFTMSMSPPSKCLRASCLRNLMSLLARRASLFSLPWPSSADLPI